MKRYVYFLLLLFAVRASAQNVRAAALVGMNPSGNLQLVNGQTGLQPQSGNIQQIAPVGLGSDNNFHYFQVDVYGNLQLGVFQSGSTLPASCIGAAVFTLTTTWQPYYCDNGTYTPFGSSSGGGDSITSPNSTLTVGGPSSATTLDFNLAHANTWTALQTFNAGLSSTLGTFTDGTEGIVARPIVSESGYGGLYAVGVTPSSTNFALSTNATTTVVNAGTTVNLAVGATGVLGCVSTLCIFPVEVSAASIVDAGITVTPSTALICPNGTLGAFTTIGCAGVTSVTVTGANGIGTSGCAITTTGTCALSLGAITPASATSITVNNQRFADGSPSTCTTTSGGSLTTQADCAFFQAVDAHTTGRNLRLNFGSGQYYVCAEWVQPTDGAFIEIVGASDASTTLVQNCSHPTTPMMTQASGFPNIMMRDITFYPNNEASSCFDLLGGATAGFIENVICDTPAVTATSGSDHFYQLGSSSYYAQDMVAVNLTSGGVPYAQTSNLASLTANGTVSLTGITINSGGSYGANSTYAVGIVNDPHGYCSSNEPAFTVTINGSGAVSGTTVTNAGTCSGGLPDLSVIDQYAVTYGAKIYASDSVFVNLFPNAGITGAVVYGGNNHFVHAHPEFVQHGIVDDSSASVYDATECDTIYSICFQFQGLGGRVVNGTIAYTAKMNNNGGSTVYQFASGATDINFGPQSNLCSGGTPTDYQEFTSTTALVIPGGTGWPSGSSITGNDHSCGYIPSGQAIDYAPSLVLSGTQITSGTVPAGRLPAALPSTTSVNGTAIPASSTLSTVPATNDTVFTVNGPGPYQGTFGPANTLMVSSIQIPQTVTLTGQTIYNGSAVAGNVMTCLYNSSGTLVASSSSTAQTGTYTSQRIPYTSTYSAAPGKYYIGLVQSSGSSNFEFVSSLGYSEDLYPGSFACSSSIALPSLTGSIVPQMGTY